MVSNTPNSFQPRFDSDDLDRLDVYSSGWNNPDLWTRVEQVIQGQFASIDNKVSGAFPNVHINVGQTSGPGFLRFIHRTFSLPGSGIDAVVMGMTFTESEDGVNVEVDVSGEETGDFVWPSLASEAKSKSELLSVARDLAARVIPSVDAIIAALANQQRSVE